MNDLWLESRKGNAEGIHRIVRSMGRAAVDAVDASGSTPLFVAASEGRIEAVRALLSYGADLSKRNEAGETPLIVSASEGHESVVRLLLESHADVNASNINGWTALICATCFNHRKCVELLIQHPDVNVDCISNTGCSALYFASREGIEDIVELLVSHSASANVPSQSGYTPLHIAAERGHTNICRQLLFAHADPDQRDLSGSTAWDLAKTQETRERIYLTVWEITVAMEETSALREQRRQLLEKWYNRQEQQSQNGNSASRTLKPPEPSCYSVEDMTNIHTADASPTTSTELSESDKHLTLSLREQEVLANVAKELGSSPHLVASLQTLGTNAYIHAQQLQYINARPPLKDFYVYFHRSLSTSVLALQALLSKMVADGRESTVESMVGNVDTLANASNIAAIPLLTGILQQLVKLPMDIHRNWVVQQVTLYFPSLESHRLLEMLAQRVTLLHQTEIYRTFRLTKRHHVESSNRSSDSPSTSVRSSKSMLTQVFESLKVSSGYLYELFVLRGEASEFYTMSPVQILASVSAGRVLDALMLLPFEQRQLIERARREQVRQSRLSGSPSKEIVNEGANEGASLSENLSGLLVSSKLSTPVTIGDLPTLVCHALALERLSDLEDLEAQWSTILRTFPSLPTSDYNSHSLYTSESSSPTSDTTFPAIHTIGGSPVKPPRPSRTNGSAASSKKLPDQIVLETAEEMKALQDVSSHQQQELKDLRSALVALQAQQTQLLLAQQQLGKQQGKNRTPNIPSGGSSPSAGQIQIQMQSQKDEAAENERESDRNDESVAITAALRLIAAQEVLLRDLVQHVQVLQEDVQTLGINKTDNVTDRIPSTPAAASFRGGIDVGADDVPNGNSAAKTTQIPEAVGCTCSMS